MDYIRRDLLTSGQLQKYIDNDGLRGMTSNPAIFEKAITGSNLLQRYRPVAGCEEAGRQRHLRKNRDSRRAGRVRHIQAGVCGNEAARRLRQPGGLAVPWLRHQKRRSEKRAALWKTVDRPNVMIKIPGTPEGLPAIRQALEDGININITLLFAQSAYEQSRRSIPFRSRSSRCEGPGHQPHCQRGELFCQPHRHSC